MFGLRTNAKNERFIKGILKQSFEVIMRLSHWREVDWMDRKQIDQKALKKVIWPLAKNASVIHDSYTCKNERLKGSDVRPFPTRRLYGKFNFVGSNGGSISLGTDGPCPKECRPKDHKEWLVC